MQRNDEDNGGRVAALASRGSRAAGGLIRRRAAGRAVLVLTLCFSAAAWYFSYSAVEQAREERFEFRTSELENAIVDRMDLYEQVLWGGVGHFNGSDSVTRDDWADFVSTLDITTHWPGILGLGYTEQLQADEIPEHVSSVRQEGLTEYRIVPEGQREEHSVVVFLEPPTERNQEMLGFDMGANIVSLRAMEAARDTGDAISSDMVTLLNEPANDIQNCFLTYIPVYSGEIHPTTVPQRRATLTGWVYAQFRMGDLMEGILGSDVDDVRYEVYDGEVSAETLAFDSREGLTGHQYADGPDLRHEATITVQRQEWVIVFVATSPFVTAIEAIQPVVIAIAALVINLLLFYLVSALGQVGTKANQLALEMTSELRSTRDDLEERSRSLEAKTKQLERSNAELGQFATVASHDLQEPLRSLRSYSALLAGKFDQQLGEEGDRWLGYIGTAAERMSDLIRELLDYSTISNGLAGQSPVDLNIVVQRAMASLEQELTASNLRSEIAKLPVVFGDSLQLERLFQNLISNASKYCDADQPFLQISCIDQGDDFRICLKDNGIGIKPQYQHRIFEIFRRVSSSVERPGTGIGLAVCTKVVEAHRGTIGVDSEIGEGSTFWFTLPKPRAGAYKPMVG